MLHQSKIITQNKIKIMLNNNGYIICTRFSFLNLFCNSRQFDVNSTFYSIRSTTLSTPFEYNTVQEILTNKQLSLSVTLKTAEISVMLP